MDTLFCSLDWRASAPINILEGWHFKRGSILSCLEHIASFNEGAQIGISVVEDKRRFPLIFFYVGIFCVYQQVHWMCSLWKISSPGILKNALKKSQIIYWWHSQDGPDDSAFWGNVRVYVPWCLRACLKMGPYTYCCSSGSVTFIPQTSSFPLMTYYWSQYIFFLEPVIAI